MPNPTPTRALRSTPPAPAATPAVVAVGSEAVEIAIRRDRRARVLRLRVPMAGDPVLTVPWGASRRAIDRFLLDHQPWLRDALSRRPRPLSLAAGTELPLRGVLHRIERAATPRGAVVSLLHGPDMPVIAVRGEPEHLPRRLTDWLKKEARADLAAAVARHAGSLGLRPASLTVRDTTSRWGSCASTGALSFSWRLVLAPPPVLDYVAAHEVAHLVHMNHSAAFWQVVAELFPGHREARAWLKREGATLHAVGAC